MRGPIKSEAAEAINREQQDEGQAQDVADDAMTSAVSGHDVLQSRKPAADRTASFPSGEPDLVDRLAAMVASGRIDNGAFAGEPQHDDEENVLGNTDMETDDPVICLPDLQQGADKDPLWNDLADGSEDPLAVPVDTDRRNRKPD